jgi:ferrous iron transport protein A
MPTLDELPPGSHATIESLEGPPALIQRLLELGLMEGEEIQVLTRAPLGDPIEIESGMTRLSIRKAEAVHVIVSRPH